MRTIKTSSYTKYANEYTLDAFEPENKQPQMDQQQMDQQQMDQQQQEQIPQQEAVTQPAVKDWKDERWYMINNFDIIATKDGQIVDGVFLLQDMETGKRYKYTVGKIRQMTGSTVEEIMSMVDMIPFERQYEQNFDPDEINNEGNIVRSGSGEGVILHRIILNNGQRHIEVIKPPNTNWDTRQQRWGNPNLEQPPGPKNRVIPQRKKRHMSRRKKKIMRKAEEYMFNKMNIQRGDKIRWYLLKFVDINVALEGNIKNIEKLGVGELTYHFLESGTKKMISLNSSNLSEEWSTKLHNAIGPYISRNDWKTHQEGRSGRMDMSGDPILFCIIDRVDGSVDVETHDLAQLKEDFKGAKDV